MSFYHCKPVILKLQERDGVYVVDKSDTSWTVEYRSARLSLRVMPGCCGILLLYHLNGKEQHLLQLLRIIGRAAAAEKFGLITLSLRSDSALRPLLKAEEGWATTPFTNPRTTNNVEVLSYALPVKVAPKPQRKHQDE